MTINWKAFQPTLQRMVMVSVLRPEILADTQARSAFIGGAKSAARITHRHVVGIYDAVETEHSCYIIQEYVPGQSLMERLLSGPRLNAKDALHIAYQVAEGLEAAWKHERLVHCNLTPRTILLDHDGTAKVSMTGQCRRANSLTPANDTGELVGIPNYLSPEQACGDPRIDCRTDIYAMGTILYHMLTGQLPFAGLSPEETLQAQLTGHLEWQAPHPPHVPAATTHLLEHMLMRNPDNRPDDWHTIGRALHKLETKHVIIQKRHHEGESTLKLVPVPA
jgi:serine/threonine protein kinase